MDWIKRGKQAGQLGAFGLLLTLANTVGKNEAAIAALNSRADRYEGFTERTFVRFESKLDRLLIREGVKPEDVPSLEKPDLLKKKE